MENGGFLDDILNCVRYAQANNPFSAYNTLVEIKDSNTDKLLDIACRLW